MTGLTEPTRATIWEDGGATCMARVVGDDNEAVQPADLKSITLKVYDDNAANHDATTSTATVTIASAVFDTLVTTDGCWDYDSTGYNFKYTIPSTVFATGGHRYRAEFVFDPAAATSNNFPVVFEFNVQPLRSS